MRSSVLPCIVDDVGALRRERDVRLFQLCSQAGAALRSGNMSPAVIGTVVVFVVVVVASVAVAVAVASVNSFTTFNSSHNPRSMASAKDRMTKY